MRLVFFGTPADAVPTLEALAAAGHDVALVVTQPDRRRGARGGQLVESPVKRAARDLGLAVETPRRAGEVVDDVRAVDADLGVVVAFGQLLPPVLLAATRHGMVNVHFSLLPRWRGAAPVERAILAGDTETGVAIMAVEDGLDTGGVFAEARVPIDDRVTAGELRARLAALGTDLLLRELPTIPGRTPRPQAGEATYAAKLEVEEFCLDPRRQASDLARVVRAGNPKPGAWCSVEGRRVKVWRARAVDTPGAPRGARDLGTIEPPGILVCAGGGLALDDVQPEGRRRMPGAAWLAGRRAGTRLDP